VASATGTGGLRGLDVRQPVGVGKGYLARLGETELEDIETCISWLEEKTWVDPDRTGIYGGSYGGYLATYALTHSEIFEVGIAFAPVTDWRLYDSIYTERYMARPENNPEGYTSSSVLEAADRLRGRLLLIHGTMDDNVHMQNTLKLADALQRSGKQFELMLYPSARHGIKDPAQIQHHYSLMTRFLLENL
jgi:dipeptidyl-peptidase-4